jgi:hypothetical protein
LKNRREGCWERLGGERDWVAERGGSRQAHGRHWPDGQGRGTQPGMEGFEPFVLYFSIFN